MMIKIENLHKSYQSLKVLDGININAEQGDVYGFIGSNGSGKTTTMNIITKLIPYNEGKITINDNKPYKLGYLPETPNIFPYLTGFEYLSYIAKCCNYQGDINQRNEEVLRLVRLFKASKRKVGGYSRGMIQRLGIAAAIYDNPDILILDEPTSALDPEGRLEVIKIINSLKEGGRTIIFSSHILDDVERVATKIGILSNGKIVVEDTINNILKKSKEMISYGLIVEDIDENKLDNLRKHGLIVTLEEQNLEIEPTTKMSSNDILKLVLNENINIIKFEEKRYDLERIYMEVTKNEPNKRND